MAEYSDPAVEEGLRSVALGSGFNKWLGIRLIAAGGGRVELEIPVRPDFTQHHGVVHGGIVGTAADTASAWAAASVSGDVVTASYTLQLLGAARGSLLRARAEVIRAGRRMVSVEARVTSEAPGDEPRLVAVALANIVPLTGGRAA